MTDESSQYYRFLIEARLGSRLKDVSGSASTRRGVSAQVQ